MKSRLTKLLAMILTTALIAASLPFYMPVAVLADSDIRVPTGDDQDTATSTKPAGSTFYELVDEYPSANDADYYTMTAPNDSHNSLSFPAFSVPAGSQILSVTVYYRAAKKGNGPANIKASIKVGENYYDTIDPGVNPAESEVFQTYSYTFTTNPASRTAWQWYHINRTDAPDYWLNAFGTASSDLAPDIKVSLVYAEVNYLPPNPVPTITGISPAVKNVGDPEFTMTVTGTDFVSSSIVRFNGNNRTTTFINSTALTAIIPTSDMAAAGTNAIRVFNPPPVGGWSNTVNFTVSVAVSLLTLTPNSGFGNTVVTISVSGGGFSVSTPGNIWFDTNNDGVMDAGEPQTPVTTDSSGNIPAGITLTTPLLTFSKTYRVRADIPSGSTIEASAIFTTPGTTGAVKITKYAADGTTVLAQTILTYQQMRDGFGDLPVMGDGVTHYYHQGPVFKDDPDPATQEMLRWNPQEDWNVQEKDYGALLGTNVKDLCDLVGGMSAGEELKVKASDGWYKMFAYKNVYEYSSREGPMVLTWQKNGMYPDTGYNEGMRLIWFADDSTNLWGIHAFGNWDWHEAAEPQYWYYYFQDGQSYPTTTGLSGQIVSELIIYSDDPIPSAPVAAFTATPTNGNAPLSVTFTDQSTNVPTSWSWDFDNDGTTDSTVQNPTYSYANAGTYTVKLTATNAHGSDEEIKTDYIVVNDSVIPPTTAFSGNPVSGTAPLAVSFTDASTGTAPLTYAWSFGDSGTSTEQNPSHEYAVAGTYTVTLTVTNSAGSDDEVKTDYITVTSPSLPWNLQLNGTDKIIMSQADFEAKVTANPLTWTDGTGNVYQGVALWRLVGIVDSDSVATMAPVFTALNYPIYIVAEDGYSEFFGSSLVDNNNNMIIANTMNGVPLPDTEYPLRLVGPGLTAGQMVSKIEKIEFSIPWNLELAGVSTYAMPKTEFETLATSNPVSWTDGTGNIWSGAALWRLVALVDDGDPATFNDALAATGYSVRIIAVDGFSKTFTSASFARNDGRIIANKLDDTPFAITYFPLRHVGAGLTSGNMVSRIVRIELINLPKTITATAGPNGTIDPLGAVSVPYNGNQTFTIIPDTGYRVADVVVDGLSAGAVTNYTFNNVVATHTIEATFASDVIAPVADFTADATSGVASLTVHFTDQSTNTPTSWAWDFDNNGSTDSADQNPTCLYNTAGTYSVKLTVTNAVGSDDEIKTDYITVSLPSYTITANAGPNGSIEPAGVVTAGEGSDQTFTITPALGYHVADVLVDNASVGAVTSYEFVGVTADHTISATFAIDTFTITATAGENGSITPSGNVTVEYGASQSFVVIPDSGYLVQDILVDGISAGAVTGYEFTSVIADHTISVTFRPDIPAPVANFSADVTSGHQPFIVSFTDQSTGTPTSWSWDFNNNGSEDSTEQNPTWTYTSPGNYTVKLTAMNAGGSDEEVKTEYITVLPRTWYVDDSGGADFTTIQAAVNAAGIGETIIVKDGNYPETVSISKSLTLRSENRHGATVNPTMPLVSPWGYIFTITASNVVIDGFNITQPTPAGNYGNYGIFLYFTALYSNCQFINNNFVNVPYAIYIGGTGQNSDNHLVASNTISYETYGQTGIMLYNARNCVVANNTITHSAGYAIYLRQQGGALCLNNTITGNTATACAAGIFLQDVSSNTFCRNTFSGNSYGISMRTQGAAIIANQFYLNSFINSTTANFYFWGNLPLDSNTVGNIWNSTAPVTFWYNGVEQTGFAGNYWGHYYNGTDANNDGIGDTPYRTRTDLVADDGVLAPDEFDNYPLMFPESSYTATPAGPVVDFSSTVQSGYAPLNVTFKNFSTGSAPLTCEWDFNNDGIADSTAVNPMYVYPAAGTYTVKLTVANAYGSNTVIRTDYISVTPMTVAFTASGRLGIAPFNVTFTDQTVGNGPFAYAWDFQNDGIIDSTDQNPSYIYAADGRYTVRLAVTNAYGTDEEVKTDHIIVKASGPWVVDASGTGDCVTIQEAVNAANPGDTIVVRNGTYPENVAVNKAITIRSEDRHGATVSPASGHVFVLTSSGVTIDGFNIIPISSYGIYYNGACNNCVFTNNYMPAANRGISIGSSSANSSNNTISGNTITLGTAGSYPIYLTHVSNSSVTDNVCSDPYRRASTSGIYVYRSSATYQSANNTISGNTLDGFNSGIYLSATTANQVYGNTATNNNYGIYLRSTTTAKAENNVLYLNNVVSSRTSNVYFYDANTLTNFWNSQIPVTYTYNGTQYSGNVGNYWGGFAGTDANGDGISETAYQARATPAEYDNYPLMAMTESYSVIATHTITASAGENGSITPSGAVTVASGASQAFSITPSIGYHVADVLVDGASVGAVTSYEFTNVAADHTISSSFAIDTFTITATAGENGSITPSGEVTVEYGASQAFTIAPSNGYRVQNVTVDGASQGAITSYAFDNVVSSHTISATFIPSWDLNGDHVINIGDVVKIGLVWGQTGAPGWIPEDLNKDGYINIGDVVVVGLHWGENW